MNFVIHHLLTTPSTNRKAKDLLLQGAPEGTVIRTDDQTAGYGRYGHTWESLKGNLMCSLILLPQKPLVQLGQIPFIASLAVAHLLTPLLKPTTNLALKWPNDVLINGEKVCGVLVEVEEVLTCSYPAAILGIGLNIQHAPKLDRSTTALSMHTSKTLSVDEMLQDLLQIFEDVYKKWQQEGFDWARRAWLEKAYLWQQDVQLQTPQELISGQFIDIDSSGGIMIRMRNREVKSFYNGHLLID